MKFPPPPKVIDGMTHGKILSQNFVKDPSTRLKPSDQVSSNCTENAGLQFICFFCLYLNININIKKWVI